MEASTTTMKRHILVNEEEEAQTLVLPSNCRWLDRYAMDEGEQSSFKKLQDVMLEQEEETPQSTLKEPRESVDGEEVVSLKKHTGDIVRMCNICNVSVLKSNWARHLRSLSHQQLKQARRDNDLTTVTPKRQHCGDPLSIPAPQPVVPTMSKHEHCDEPLSVLSEPIIALPIQTKTLDLSLKPMSKKKKENPQLICRTTERLPELPPSTCKTVEPSSLTMELEKVALRKTFQNYVIRNQCGYMDLQLFLKDCSPPVCQQLSAVLKKSPVKYQLLVEADYCRGVEPNKKIQTMNFKTKNIILLTEGSSVTKHYNKRREEILQESEEFQMKGSNWSLVHIKRMELHISKFHPLKGSSYIPLPRKIQQKRAVVNVQNKDQKCFLWAVLSALHPVKVNSGRINNYTKYENEFDNALRGVEFPMKLNKIKRFEKRSGVSINVYAYDAKYNIFPLHITKQEVKGRHVDLLYVKNSETSHFCWIKNLSRLVSAQLSHHEHKMWLCNRCLLFFNTKKALESHTADCKCHDGIRTKMPEKWNSTLSFKDHFKSMTVPFVCYADFECCLTTVANENRYQKHVPVSFCYYIVRNGGGAYFKDPVTYFGSDAAQQFVRMLKKEAVNINRIYNNVVQMKPLTPAQEREHQLASLCHICKDELGQNDVKVYDHDHLTGLYRGPAHNHCNLQYKKPTFLPVFIHNLSGYDAHLFIKSFGLEQEKIDVIANNEERYISFTVHVHAGVKLRFLDSFKFVHSSLDNLVKNLSRSQFIHMSKFFSDDRIDLLLRKGVYPYDYMSSLEKYEETSLPPKDKFYNILNEADISEQDYVHAKSVWEVFEIRNMKAYTVFYNKSDVLLLADVMENFRSLCKTTYDLDPAWFFTAPGLAWSALLKISGIRLSLLTESEHFTMVEKSIRGGVSQCSHRYGKANHRYMTDYDAGCDSTFLMYYDANNLYGWAMSQYMPYGDFRWNDTNIDVTGVPDDADTGYFLEVDLEYPRDLHDSHADLPLAPEHMCPPGSGSKQKKLLTTLFDKEKYVLHYRTLKQYISLGMKLKRIHRVLAFSQKAWMKVYIDLNTDLRTKATTDFEKDFYKLMNNAVFGKTMENVRKRSDIRLVTDVKKAKKLIAKPSFKSRTIFTKDLAAIHMYKENILLDKPIYVGASVLDISKTLMYEFHYSVMKRKYGDDRLTLLYTDTDSLIYKIATVDVYSDMCEMIIYFDTSDYLVDNIYGLPRVNKKVLGKMKDELNGQLLRRFVGLRSKMYALETDTMTVKRSKGVKRLVVEEDLRFEHYLECLRGGRQRYIPMNQINSRNHDVYSIELWKMALSPDDDKRSILSDGISTLPWGHYRLKEDDLKS